MIKADEIKHVAGENGTPTCRATSGADGLDLYLTEVPRGSARAVRRLRAYGTLAEPIKAMLQERRRTTVQGSLLPDEGHRPRGIDSPMPSPIVRTHPVTGGRVSTSTEFRAPHPQLRGQGDALLEMLYRHIETPEFQCR